MIRLLALALGLALLRHLVMWDAVLVSPAALVAGLERQPVVVEWEQGPALDAIQKGEYQPVDLRRQLALPIIGGRLAWQLPLPHSLTILERYRKSAEAESKPLMFLAASEDRDAGLKVARAVCEALGVRAAGFIIWENR